MSQVSSLAIIVGCGIICLCKTRIGEKMSDKFNITPKREKELVETFKKRDDRIHGGDWNEEPEGCEDGHGGSHSGNLDGSFQNKSAVGGKGEIKIYDDSDSSRKVEEQARESFQNQKLFDERVASIKPGDKWDSESKGGPPKNPRELLGLS